MLYVKIHYHLYLYENIWQVKIEDKFSHIQEHAVPMTDAMHHFNPNELFVDVIEKLVYYPTKSCTQPLKKSVLT